MVFKLKPTYLDSIYFRRFLQEKKSNFGNFLLSI